MRTCFLIAPIGAPGSDTRRRTDRFEKHILVEALSGLQFNVVRADKIAASGMITNQIMKEILSADLAVVDLTDHNPNVFYEMGIRHVTRRPIVHVKQKGTTIPFDNANMRTLDYDFEIDNLEHTVTSLRTTIESSFETEAENPFSAATETFLTIRGKGTARAFQSLDILDGFEALSRHFAFLLSQAQPGTLYWGQTVGGGAFPEGAENILRSAIDKGASIKLIVNENPPNSERILAVLKALSAPDQVKAIRCTNCNLRFFGMGTTHLVISVRIDGRYNGIIIRDYDFITFVKQWFEMRAQELEKGGPSTQ